MATDLPLTITLSGGFPVGYKAAPAAFGEDLVARMRIQSVNEFVLLTSGSTEPSSNVGPWLKNGNELYVWDDDVGGYVPQTLDFSSVEDGSIPQSKLASGTIVNPRPFRASSQGTGQSIAAVAAGISTGLTDIVMPTESFDPDGVYNPVTSIFQAVEAGWYVTSFAFQVDNNGDAPAALATMQMGIFVADGDTNANLGGGVTTNVPSPYGDRWFLTSNDVIQLSAGQKCKLRGYALDTVGTGYVDITNNCYWSMYMIKLLQA